MGFVLAIGVGLPMHVQAHEDAGELLDIVSLDLAFTLEMRFPNYGEQTIFPDLPCGATVSVPDVVAGQRVPIPRTAEGACPRRVTTQLLNEAPTMIEFEPAGCMEETPPTCTHWIQHSVLIETSESVDDERCEVVIDEAKARDTIRRKVLRHLSEAESRRFLGADDGAVDDVRAH
jgi:hypothetical protein